MKLLRKWRELPFEQKLSILIVPLLLALLSGIVIPRVNDWTTKEEETTDLRLVDLVVTVPKSNMPVLTVTLHNAGNRRAIVKRAVFRILYYDYAGCTVGGITISGKYDVALPVSHYDPADVVGKIVNVPMSQQLGKDEPDRFSFRIRPALAKDDLTSLAYLYQLDVALIDSNDQKLDAGKVVVSLPDNGPPFEPIYPSGPSECAAQAYKNLLRLEGARSPGLQELSTHLGP